MEARYSVFLYSKYSQSSKQLNDAMQRSGVDFFGKLGLQPLCVDNPKVRERIRNNESIDVTTVPCVLIIFTDGGVEKYEGPHAFQWVQAMAERYAPPPPPPPPPRPVQAPEVPRQVQQREEPESVQPRPQQGSKRPRMKKIRQEQDIPPDPRPVPRAAPRNPPPEPGQGATPIDDVPIDEEQEIGDRYKTLKPPARILRDQGNYEEIEELYGGEQVDMHRAQKSAVRPHIQQTRANNPKDIMAVADEMRKGRAQIEQMKPRGGQTQNRP